MTHKWTAGQQAVLERRIVTIERVTPSGRAVVAGRQFKPDGYEIGGKRYGIFLRHLTPEVAAEIELAEQTQATRHRLYKATQVVEKWFGKNCSSYSRFLMTAEQIAFANRLAEAIEMAMGDSP